ncbi:hypothetical protein FRX31_017945 [Thalictrum thalictroides]|uniref:Uncharacterized protein n=1 Tax=Thalictrum thalictroides TaxID=46969 RepID=A0A7J6W604_THATH|nr:hypothetical protein FRX31_017945 [Thalictrum thalictroides]
MFDSNKWLSSRFAILDKGKEVENTVLNSTFWKKVEYVRKSVDPVLQVLLKMDSDDTITGVHLYMAGLATHFLSPSYRYRPDFVEITDFRLVKADFKTELAVSIRRELDPEEHYIDENEIGNPDVRKGLVEILTLEDAALELHQATDDNIGFLEDLTGSLITSSNLTQK